ncbi:MAG: hypothetical protein FJX78_06165 [Armatimonadetes bacterium]|nr:hypothetical protein [Armatimonadota bacterium]
MADDAETGPSMTDTMGAVWDRMNTEPPPAVPADAPESPPPAAPAEEAAPKTASDAPARGPDGRFAKSAAPAADQDKTELTPAADTPDPAKPATAEIDIPKSWAAEKHDLFRKADPGLRAYIAQRESEMRKGIDDLHGQLGEKAKLADDIGRALAPYEAMIRAERATPAQVVEALLPAAYVLRVGSPQQKLDLIRRTAEQWGIDLGQLAKPSENIAELDPYVAETRRELSQVKARLEAFDRASQQTRLDAIQSAINAFADEKDANGNPLRPHFDEVANDIGLLLKNGRAADFAQAYDMAVYANPTTRARVLEAEKQAAEAKRLAEAKTRASEARRIAETNVTSKAGATSQPGQTLRDSLERGYQRAQTA